MPLLQHPTVMIQLMDMSGRQVEDTIVWDMDIVPGDGDRIEWHGNLYLVKGNRIFMRNPERLFLQATYAGELLP